MGYEAEVQAK